jgi:hypothetical protein
MSRFQTFNYLIGSLTAVLLMSSQSSSLLANSTIQYIQGIVQTKVYFSIMSSYRSLSFKKFVFICRAFLFPLTFREYHRHPE